MKYVECFGAVYRLTAKSYKRLIADIAAGKDTNLDEYGVCLTVHMESLIELQRQRAA